MLIKTVYYIKKRLEMNIYASLLVHILNKQFNASLWRGYSCVLLGVDTHPHTIIRNYNPQKTHTLTSAQKTCTQFQRFLTVFFDFFDVFISFRYLPDDSCLENFMKPKVAYKLPWH